MYMYLINMLLVKTANITLQLTGGNNMEGAEKTVTPKPEHLVEEYKEACADIRHYGNFRSWQLAAFIAITGAALTVAFSANVAGNQIYELVVAALGVLVAVAVFILDRRAVDYSDAYIKRWIAIEGQLGLSRLTIGVPKPFLGIKARYAASAIYWGVIIVWFVVVSVGMCNET
jgi:hypothetical protein